MIMYVCGLSTQNPTHKILVILYRHGHFVAIHLSYTKPLMVEIDYSSVIAITL